MMGFSKYPRECSYGHLNCVVISILQNEHGSADSSSVKFINFAVVLMYFVTSYSLWNNPVQFEEGRRRL